MCPEFIALQNSQTVIYFISALLCHFPLNWSFVVRSILSSNSVEIPFRAKYALFLGGRDLGISSAVPPAHNNFPWLGCPVLMVRKQYVLSPQENDTKSFDRTWEWKLCRRRYWMWMTIIEAVFYQKLPNNTAPGQPLAITLTLHHGTSRSAVCDSWKCCCTWRAKRALKGARYSSDA